MVSKDVYHLQQHKYSYNVTKLTIDQSFTMWTINLHSFLPRDAMLSAVYAVVACLSVCVSVCLCVCHTPVLYQNG